MNREIESLAKSIFDSIAMGIYVFQLEDIDDDRSLRLVFANKESIKFTGLTKENIIGKTMDSNFPGLREMGIPLKCADVVGSQKPTRLADIFYGDDRISENWFSVNAFPLPDHFVGMSFENISARKQAEIENQKMIIELKRALSEIKTLQGILPICMDCKQIRNDEGLWTQVDKYLQAHTHAEFTHGICDDCLEKRYSENDNQLE